MWTEKTVDRESPQKLYVQIYSIIKEMIDSGEWAANEHIPSEDELCRTFDVSKATVRLAISELVREGYLKRQQGKGTFVSTTGHQFGMAMKTRLTEDIYSEGIRTEKELLTKGLRESPEDVRGYFKGIGHLFAVQCKGFIDGEPAYLEELFLPLGILPTIDDEPLCRVPFFELIQERSTKRIFKVVQTIEVTNLRRDVAEALGVRDESPALLLHRILLGTDGNPIAYIRLYGKVGRYKILTELERIK